MCKKIYAARETTATRVDRDATRVDSDAVAGRFWRRGLEGAEREREREKRERERKIEKLPTASLRESRAVSRSEISRVSE